MKIYNKYQNDHKPRRHWRDIWPFDDRKLIIRNTGCKFELNPKLKEYSDKVWEEKAKAGWISSWVLATEYISFSDTEIEIGAGAMHYSDIYGISLAIEQHKPFAPQQGFNNSISVGFPVCTLDGFVIFERRPAEVRLPRSVMHPGCGFWSSRALVKDMSESADPKLAKDPKFFDLTLQLEARKVEIANIFKISPEVISYEPTQKFLAVGDDSVEMFISTTGKISLEKSQLSLPEKEIIFVPVENLKQLILNQKDLVGIDPRGYKSDDITKMRLHEETLLALIYGYQGLTGEDTLNVKQTLDELNQAGYDFRVYDTAPSVKYKFSINY